MAAKHWNIGMLRQAACSFRELTIIQVVVVSPAIAPSGKFSPSNPPGFNLREA